MTLGPAELAEQDQRTASNPQVSAFVSASAGSGKTKLLTDRLLRLMLAGAEPGRIQCLTFTRAAAAEMAVRLQQRLGRWVRLPEDKLDAELRGLALMPDAALRSQARTLFARVLDLPGGMRIETIHAFCQSLLRRFPLEAALSPYFRVMEDTEAGALQARAREAALLAPELAASAVATLAPEVLPKDLAGAIGALQARRGSLERALQGGVAALVEAQRAVLGLRAGEDEESILLAGMAEMDVAGMRAAMAALACAKPHKRIDTRRAVVEAWLAGVPHAPGSAFHQWASFFLDGEGDEYKQLVGVEFGRLRPDVVAVLQDEQARVAAVLARARTARVAVLSAALVQLAAPAVAAYEQDKRQAEMLDYSDLIGRARDLLREPMAAWVLYKLDGGLDHLLLDEVQDTAPEQWEIAGAISGEFFDGEGARDGGAVPRSVFAVGDPKQSIYSFQGADPDGFDRWRQRMGERVRQAGMAFEDVPLHVSFRSTAPVLALVDAVFAHPGPDMGLPEAGKVQHVANRAGQAGRVELWPKVPRPDKQAAASWEPGTEAAAPAAPERLAHAVADWIAAHTDGSDMLGSAGRAMGPGDVLVLVRSRGVFDRTLLRALKRRGVPVAGLDRMVLAEQPAVADLLALCDVLLLPGDELQLACVLTSPLGGLSDDGLMDLALGRTTGLWETLQARAGEQPGWAWAAGWLRGLLGRVDFVTPHALLAEVLGEGGGRARLLARLGPEAAEAIDEVLTRALEYGAAEAPSLQGFVRWLRQSGSEVKRQAEGQSDRVRIMTVHGAKGLEAPVVILPASYGLSTHQPALAWVEHNGGLVPLWGPRKDTRDALLAEKLGQLRDDERREHYRLLYVALTRARDRLVVCGWETRGKGDGWYEAVQTGFGRLAAVRREAFAEVAEPWEGEWLCVESAQAAAVEATPVVPAPSVGVLPEWAGAARGWQADPPPVEPPLPASYAPSRPDGVALGPVPAAASPIAERGQQRRRFERGALVHALLQHLPALPEPERRDAAVAWLARPANRLTPGEVGRLADEVLGLLTDPRLAVLFGPGSRAEVPLTGVLETADGRLAVGGLVDRLAVLPDRVVVADYKTNREPPDSLEAVPALYLRQMAAYRYVLRRIYPGRAVECALVWTRGARIDWLPAALLERHLPGGPGAG